MKLKLTASAFMILIGFSFSQASAAVCKVEMHDIGSIVGIGSTHEEAFEDAATKCFDRRVALRGGMPDEETALELINICANIKCESKARN